MFQMHGLYVITLLVFVVGPAIAARGDSLDGLPVDPPASTFYDVNQHQVDPYSEWKKSPTTTLPSTEASTTPATTTTTPQPATVKQPKTTSTAVIETTMSATDEFLEELAKEEEGLVEDDPYSTTMFPDGLEATTLSALAETEMMAEETYLEQEEQELTKEIAAEQDEGWKEMEEEELKEVEEEEQIIKEELEKTLGETSPPTSTNRSATTPAITASSSTTTDTTPESTTATSAWSDILNIDDLLYVESVYSRFNTFTDIYSTVHLRGLFEKFSAQHGTCEPRKLSIFGGNIGYLSG
ncbi:hypothetical protein CAPTEDRAFT_203104 [Capitella teleta]|uniref:SEA domain-containing protein n=1 Tax=Capitella teleta TaxID=283909 RepID=R7V5D8_CAPTE|nr:hypothetical protein CAPTEDRAFT_203104 [Capitella teleta]|eukprot:ELU11005.1 hypothetical protein CAPTEDRAFT_203104 [Capitella teleta]